MMLEVNHSLRIRVNQRWHKGCDYGCMGKIAPNHFSDRISYAAGKAGYKPVDLARAAGLSRAAVSKWFTGQADSIRPSNLYKVAELLGVNPRWLATGEGDPWEVDYNRIINKLSEEERDHIRYILQLMTDKDYIRGSNTPSQEGSRGRDRKNTKKATTEES